MADPSDPAGTSPLTPEPPPAEEAAQPSAGDRYDLSGDFRGAVINIKSTIVSNAEVKDIESLPPEPGEPPYQGMQYFDEKDAGRFFGREALVAKIAGRLAQTRFLAIIGASGSGKSSLVRAGVIPALRAGDRLYDGSMPPLGSDQWDIRIFTPGASPLEAMANSLAADPGSATETTSLQTELAQSTEALNGIVAGVLKQNGRNRLLLVIDQFEEIFTQCHHDEERKSFIGNLLQAVDPAKLQPITILVTLRADLYAQLAAEDRLRELVSQNQEFIGAMSREELERAILRPAVLGNWKVQEGLVEVVLDDLGDEPGALPLLSHALLETWKRRHGRVMTLSGYVASGGVRGAIAQTAETVFRQQLTPAQQLIARTIFIKLAEMGESSLDTRRRAAFSELITRSTDIQTIDVVLDILTDARLVTTDTVEPGDTRVVEISHEALIREWPTLRDWLNQDRDGLILYRQLTEDANDWLKLGRDPGALYRGARLDKAIEWAKSNPDMVSLSEQDFLDASQKIAGEEQSRVRMLARARGNEIRLGGAAGVLVIAIIVVVLAANGFFAPRTMNGVFNIAVAEFGELGSDGQIRSSNTAEKMSGWAANYVRDQVKGDPNLLVWPYEGNLFNRTRVALAKPETASEIAESIHADILLYGYVDRRASPPQLVLKFWIPPQAKYRFEDLQGDFSLGSPIRIADLNNPGISVQGELERQSGALAWVGMGVAQEQLGQSEEALKSFQHAAELAPQSETVQFFLGREYLFLSDVQQEQREQDWQASEQAFKQAIQINPSYARAFIGLGSVYFKRAAYFLDATSDPQKISQSQAPSWVQQSLQAYQKAVDLKPDSKEYGNPVLDVALMSLGDAYRLQGILQSDQGDQAAALSSLQQAAVLLEQVRPAFEQATAQHETYRRYLAQAYEFAGETYQWQGYVFGLQKDNTSALASYRKSLDAYKQCIAQGDPKITSDLIIQNDIVAKFCQPYMQDTQQAYDSLNGGP